MSKFLNISNHTLSFEQVEELKAKGFDEIVELPAELKAAWAQCNPESYRDLCKKIKDFMKENGITSAHLAGFPAAVSYMCVKPVRGTAFFYAFSERVSVEETQADGSVVKKNVFKHKGFFEYELNWDSNEI